MKKLFFAIIAVNCIFIACNSPYVDAPFVPGGGAASRSSGVPGTIVATQGGKRGIELRWDEVSGAVRYNIFKANSPLESFAQCAETTAIQYKFTVPPGSTVYYKVSSVSQDGRESPQSIYVRGTSLAQPVITDITDVTEASATVTWYMDNAQEDTYKNDLLYTVYCFEGSTEVAHIALDGAALAENKVSFANLKPNFQYEYQVEAYLRGDQSNSEKSDKVDAVTARRMRPAAPVSLRAARGTATNKIELFFELPDMVDIALGNGQFEPRPVYFVISKRLYSESGRNEYQPACSYFGSITANAGVPGGKTFTSYTPGTTVTWTDDNVSDSSRGVKYEYQVQSYVEEKKTSADSSKASAVGWALSEGSLSFGDIVYELNELGSAYTSAELPLVFDFDPQGETYGYALVETIEPVEDDHENDPASVISKEPDILSYDEITNYIARMDLTQKTTELTPGRGLYSYEVEIKNLNGDTIDTVATIGKVEVSENTEPIIVEGFSVQDGYTDRFVFKWHYHENRKYILYMSNNRINWTEIDVVNENPDNNSTVRNDNYSHTYTAQGIIPGLTRYFAIRPYRDIGGGEFAAGQMVYASAASRTLGVPGLSLSGAVSYSLITATWTPVQKADTYRIKYWYADTGSYATAETLPTIKTSDLAIDAGGSFKFSFMPFENNTADAANAGKEIQVAVDALNEDLRARVGGGEISTSSKETPAQTRLVGPALLNPSATRAASPTEINVSWEKITGANGYYVFRRQFNMTNTAEEGVEAIVYYVPASEASSINVTGKNLTLDSSNTKVDTQTVKASASFAGSRYTLRDMYLSDSEYDGSYNGHIPAYRDQQNNMAQGFSYRYYVVPVVNRGSSPEPLASIEFVYAKDGANKNTNITSYTIQENGVNIRYNGAAAFEKNGFTIGFGQNVTATKGTYAVQNSNINSGIQVTWNAPHLAGTGITPAYDVYRKAYDAGTWVKITTVNNLAYTDSSASITKGIAYEYLIGISNGSSASEPSASTRFIESCRAAKDEKGRPNMLGYMLDMVRMESVSRNEQKVGNDFAEEVKWYSAGVKNAYSTDNNWGIDGYTVWVMNRNIDASWHEIADISSNIPNQTNLSVKVTNNTGLLKVMRDYKHYFKVRCYVLNNGDKVYCPDPEWNFETLFAANRNNQDNASFLQTDYVKWGARQITPTEFARIASLHIAWGVHNVRGNAPINWQSTLATRWIDTSNNGSSGRVGCQSSSGVGKWWFYFDKYKPDLDTNANRNNWTYSTTFLMINADNGDRYSSKMIYGDSSAAGTFPNWYGRDGSDPYGSQYIDITGPACVNGLYSGGLRYNGTSSSTALTWTGGTIQVIYPAGAAAVQISGGGQINTPLPYSNQAANSATGDRRRTTSDAWY